MRKIDYTDQVFGKLTVVSPSHIGPRGQSFWLVRCECGVEKIVRISHLVDGSTVSCGCHRMVRPLKHGACDTSEYRIWKNMKRRCLNPGVKDAPLYSERGIKVCPRWIESFDNFFADMGERPTTKHSLDRVDVNGDYCPENCRWATPAQQNRNTRRNIKISIGGVTKCASDWAECNGIPPKIAIQRIGKLGWDPIRAVTTPVIRMAARKAA